MTSRRVCFDHGPLPGGTEFTAPRRVITVHRPQDVAPAFAALQEAQAQGLWLAGFAAYDLGYLLDPKLHALMPKDPVGPLLQFGVFEAPRPWQPSPETAPAALAPFRPLWDFARYQRAFAAVDDYIAAGDIYQANLTIPLASHLAGPPDALYARLRARQPVPHGALVDLGGVTLLSRSPELFFSLDAEGLLTTRPMKGTAPRDPDPARDDALREWLRQSEKNRAENLMIVDLLRNDMSRISQIGSVRVPELFAVERYATLHQMTSRITARLNSGTTLAQIFTALFPCGSITGAPKLRAMQILRKLEDHPRGAYCGSIGWIAPDGRMAFNVAIRTLICTPGGGVTLNAGGGIVHGSTARAEYDEALLKTRFAALD